MAHDPTRTTVHPDGTVRHPDGSVRHPDGTVTHPTHTHERVVVDERPRGGGGRVIAGILLVVALLLLVAWALGLFTVNTEGQLRAPEVRLEGGEAPRVSVDTANVRTGTTQQTVEVPTVRTEERTIEVPTVEVERANRN